jgi:hypothetical protein
MEPEGYVHQEPSLVLTWIQMCWIFFLKIIQVPYTGDQGFKFLYFQKITFNTRMKIRWGDRNARIATQVFPASAVTCVGFVFVNSGGSPNVCPRMYIYTFISNQNN